MTAAAVAQRLGLSEAAVAAFSGTGAEFAQFFGKALSEGEWAVGELAPPATLPGTVTNVVPSVVSPTQVSIAFTAPDDGGSPITRYSFYPFPAVAVTHDQADVTSPIVVTGPFASGVAYSFTMRAHNAVGESAGESDSSPQVTPNP